MEGPRSLTTLPHEIITQIGSYVCPADSSGSPRALSQLTQTCKRLKDAFQPILFRAYTHRSQHISRLVAFLRAIASRPDLAAAITSLSFHHPLDDTGLTTTDKGFINKCITNLGLPPPPERWYTDGLNRHTLLETVLAYTPNLETLHLPVNEEWHLDLLPSFSKASPKIEFRRLRHLSINYYFIAGDRWAVRYDQIAPLLEASPNLEYLSLPSVEGFSERWGNLKVPEMTLVKTLNLGESSPGLFFVTSIITSCKLLRSFELHWVRSSGYDESHEEWSVVEVWDALVRVKGTIQEITFESISDIPLGSPTANSVSSLSEFTELKVLKVDGRSFEGMFRAWTLKSGSSDMDEFVAQLLPSGIRSLAIWSPNHALIPAFLALARAKSRGLYESLMTVEIGVSTVFKEWFPMPEWSRNEADMREEFARAGVQLEMDIPNIPPDMLDFILQAGLFG